MAVKFPSPNLQPSKNDVFSVSDWAGGVNEEAAGDELEKNESSIIQNMSNDIKGQLRNMREVEEYDANTTFQTVYQYVIVEADGAEYIVAYRYGGSPVVHTIDVWSVSGNAWLASPLHTLPSDTLSVHMHVGSWAGETVVYITYVSGTRATNEVSAMLTVMYKRQRGSLWFLAGADVKDTVTTLATSVSKTSQYARTITGTNSEFQTSSETPLSRGDIVAITNVSNWHDSTVRRLARVVNVNSETELELDHVIEADDATGQGYLYKITGEFSDTVFNDGSTGDYGWWCREGMPAPPDVDVSTWDASHRYGWYKTGRYQGGITLNVLSADPPTHDDTSLYDYGQTVTYGFSWVLANGANTEIAESAYVIEGGIKEEALETPLSLTINICDTIFPTETEYDDVIGINIWRKVKGDTDFGFYDYVARTGQQAEVTPEMWYEGNGAGFIDCDSFGASLGGLPVLQWVEEEEVTGGDSNEYMERKANTLGSIDVGAALAETYRSVTGLYEFEARGSINGACSASRGDRLFVGAPYFPVGTESAPEYLDDDVRYSVSDAPILFRGTNTIGYRSGASDYIVGMVTHGARLFIFKRRSMVVVNTESPNDYEWSPVGEWPVGLLASHLVTTAREGPIWCSDEGIYIMGQNGPVSITKKIRSTYLDMTESPGLCFLGFDPYRNRVYLGDNYEVWHAGVSGNEPGWKQQIFRVDWFATAPDGRLTYLYRNGANSIINYVEATGSRAPIEGVFEWRLGERFAGTSASKLKLKKAYLTYQYAITGSGTEPSAVLSAYVDGTTVTTASLDFDGAAGSATQEIRLSGKGRTFDVKIRVQGIAGQKAVMFWLKRVDLVIRRKRAK